MNYVGMLTELHTSELLIHTFDLLYLPLDINAGLFFHTCCDFLCETFDFFRGSETILHEYDRLFLEQLHVPSFIASQITDVIENPSERNFDKVRPFSRCKVEPCQRKPGEVGKSLFKLVKSLLRDDWVFEK